MHCRAWIQKMNSHHMSNSTTPRPYDKKVMVGASRVAASCVRWSQYCLPSMGMF